MMQPFYQIQIPEHATFPVKIVNQVPFIEGHLNGQPVTFLFDSGGQTTTLNARYFQPGELDQSKNTMGATGSIPTFESTVDELSFGDWKFNNYTCHAIDMGHLESYWGMPVHGLLGFRHLIHLDWMIDYEAGMLHIWRKAPVEDFKIKAQLRLGYQYYFPGIQIKMADQAFWFLIDTGAPDITCHTGIENAILPFLEEVKTKDLDSASQTSVEVNAGILPGFQVEDLNFGPANIEFTDLTHMREHFGAFDGIIGYHLLKRYRTILSWNSRGLWFLED